MTMKLVMSNKIN